jgi:hypothetical protein
MMVRQQFFVMMIYLKFVSSRKPKKDVFIKKMPYTMKIVPGTSTFIDIF